MSCSSLSSQSTSVEKINQNSILGTWKYIEKDIALNPLEGGTVTRKITRTARFETNGTVYFKEDGIDEDGDKWLQGTSPWWSASWSKTDNKLTISNVNIPFNAYWAGKIFPCDRPNVQRSFEIISLTQNKLIILDYDGAPIKIKRH